MKDLPYDIWSQITSHLPDYYVEDLYAVNRALFDIAMDLLHQEVVISHERQDGKDIRSFFQNPLLWKRPKTLRIQLCCIFGRKLETDSALKRLRQSTLKTIQEYIQKLDPAAELTKIVVDVMPRLIGVVKLEISTCSYCEISFISGELEFHKSKQSNLLIHHVWNIFKARLYQVEINCPIELVTHLQLPTSSHFSSLENFSFRTFSLLVPHLTYNPPHAEDLSQTVVPFLKGHQSTLRDVSLTISAFLIDTSLIFQGLQGMSSLKSLEISLPFLSLSKTPFHGYPLLIAHSHSLKSLSLIFGIYPETSFQGPPFFSQDWCLVDLPHLTNLTLAPPRVPFCPSFTNYVYRFSTSLVSLTILYDPELTHSDIKEFCKTLVEFQSLRCLDLSVLGFSPTILAEFASALPRLRSLILNYRIICPYQNQDSLGTSLQNVFLRELKEHATLFSRWELESLAYLPNVYAHQPLPVAYLIFLWETQDMLVEYLHILPKVGRVGREAFARKRLREERLPSSV